MRGREEHTETAQTALGAKSQKRCAMPYTEHAAKVLMAMSGGVDSSVAALLLLQEGCHVTGGTMELVSDEARDAAFDTTPDNQWIGSHSADIAKEARAICERIGIEHLTFDLRSTFEEKVIERFCSAYMHGRTPNPCADCNRFLKFGALHDRRRELGIDYLATGHYVRRRFDRTSGCWQLLRGRDSFKDQSYFLYGITQEQLVNTLFPLGELTKEEVRKIARESGFANADAPESQDICFVPTGSYIDFIMRRIGDSDAAGAFREGPIVDRGGNLLGTHNGLIRYTIGQRKGIGVAAAEPLYVLAKDLDVNRLVVGTSEEVSTAGVKAHDINLINAEDMAYPQRVQVKTHYRQKPLQAIAEQTGDDELTVSFDEPQRAAAPGQAAVIYDGDIVLGGGTITECI